MASTGRMFVIGNKKEIISEEKIYIKIHYPFLWVSSLF